MLALEGVLHRVRRADDRAAATAATATRGEAVEHVDVARRAHDDALAERSPVAAAEQQDNAAGRRRAQAALYEVGWHGTRRQPVRAGRPCGEEQLTAIVLQPVAGEVQQQHVVGACVGEEVLDACLDLVRGLVADDLDVEAPDRRVAENGGWGLGVRRRRRQGTQPGVLVLVDGDDEGRAPAGHRQPADAWRCTNSSISRSCSLADACDSSSTSPPSSTRTVRAGPGERASQPLIAATTAVSAVADCPRTTIRPPTVAASSPRVPGGASPAGSAPTRSTSSCASSRRR